MRLPILLACSAALALAQDQPAPRKADKKTADKRPANNPQPITIPKDAKPTADGSFSYTDAQGKKWLYRNTPFGVSKVEDKPKPKDAPLEDTTTRVTIEGDTVKFEKQSPFGPVHWQKKMSDLDQTEAAIVAREQKKQSKP